MSTPRGNKKYFTVNTLIRKISEQIKPLCGTNGQRTHRRGSGTASQRRARANNRGWWNFSAENNRVQLKPNSRLKDNFVINKLIK